MFLSITLGICGAVRAEYLDKAGQIKGIKWAEQGL